MHLITSSLLTLPTFIKLTGILLVFKKFNKASKLPKVLAITTTPYLLTFSFFLTSTISVSNSVVYSFNSSSLLYTYNYDPATASSKSGADIFIPYAAFISLKCKYSFFTLISFIG